MKLKNINNGFFVLINKCWEEQSKIVKVGQPKQSELLNNETISDVFGFFTSIICNI